MAGLDNVYDTESTLTTPPSNPAPDALAFEQAIAQLEGIIESIESGQIGLEKSISEYERGVGLIRRCRQVLDRAEQRVEELTAQMQSEQARTGTEARGTAPPPDTKDGTPF